jgi:E3 ubiquitin-protein ligase SIAH1
MDAVDDVGFATIHPHLDASSRAAAFPNPKGGRGGGGVGGMVAPGRSVHELLECPVCINSMYPPIYQVL